MKLLDGESTGGIGSKLDRRGFLRGASIDAIGAAAAGVPNIALAQAPPAPPAAAPATPPAAAPAPPAPFNFPGKNPALRVLSENPYNVETPVALLDDDDTPYANFFMRNHGNMPAMPADPDTWAITIDGEVNTPLTLTLGEIKSRFENVTAHMVLECAGNGRSFFVPPASGNQWTNGGVGCAAWTGVRIRDLLDAAGVRPTAVYTAHIGADTHLTDPAALTLSRGVPIAKAMNEHSLLVFGMNGEPLPLAQGGPARLIYPGFPGSASHKWITRIWIRDVVHDGPGMTGRSYRLPVIPMVPGTEADPANLAIIETMPLRSIITSPANGTRLPAGTRTIALRGHAWAGEGKEVAAVHVSADGGQTWHEATLGAQRNAYDWHRWTAEIEVPRQGYYDIWARATDTAGNSQPHIAANWNPNGYNGNKMHEVAVLIEG